MVEPGDISVSGQENGTAPKESPLARAQALGLTVDGQLVKNELQIDKGIIAAFVGGFEGRTFPKPGDTSSRLTELYIVVPRPYYTIVPPEESGLSRVRIDADRVCVLDGETVSWPEQTKDTAQRQELLHKILDAYENMRVHGVRVPDDVAVSLNLPRTDAITAFTDFSERFPRTASIIPNDMREGTLAEAAAAEAAAKAEELRRREYGIRITREQEEQQLGPFAEELRANINALAGYTDTQGERIPGSLLTEPLDEELLNTIKRGLDERARLPSGVRIIREFLTENFLKLSASSKSSLLLPRPDGFSLERGTPPIVPDYFGVTRSSGTLRVEQTDQSGNIPLVVDGEFTGINIEPTDPDLHIQRVKRFKRNGAAPGDFADTLDDSPTGLTDAYELVEDSKNDFRPTFQITLTERAPSGVEETYRVWRVNDGILVQCSGSDMPTYYKRDMIAIGNVQVSRKPVIYLYPTEKTDITVQLDYKGKLTNTYPQIIGDTWQVKASPDGTLTTNGKKYKYLFWDGVNGEVDWDWSEGFCVRKDEIDSFLEDKIERLGLNFAEAQDFITYWAPMMKQNEWSFVSFQTEKYEALARLTITPRPDALIRLFMVFKKVDGKMKIRKQKLKKIKRKGFTVVEWGGSNLDELVAQERKEDRFVIRPRKAIASFL